jgi:hypothetical protein
VSYRSECGGVWTPTPIERAAAWELYVELVTRITTVEQKPGSGIVREELNSIYSLFDRTREILCRYGPRLAPIDRPGLPTFASLAVGMLNDVLRPLLTRWHPALGEWEAGRPDGVSVVAHERHWKHLDEARGAIAEARHVLLELAAVLHDGMRIQPLVADPNLTGGEELN